MSKDVTSILIVGVGGQGTLLASKLLGEVVCDQGYDVKVSEVHGMSQRGGSVVTYVKYGEKVYSPLIDAGEADVMVAFELLEAVRYLPFLKKGGTIVVNDQKIDPMPVIIGSAQYPQNLLEELTAAGVKLLAMDGLAVAAEAGNAKAVNVVLMGALAKQLPYPKEVWEKALTKVVPPKFLEMNKRAFVLGYEHP
ncbi:indolepyruvate oxidoreductase subunit beta [Oscillospiraceae bacterium MB08-C2-2]|nr:indolepyruvate oxidoreductase subunit beta [Oscillospiraceae bacterium MB08-C2-2]